MDERWLTVKQIGEHLQVTEATVNRWLRTGDLRGVNFGGRTGYRVRASEFERFLAEREGNAAA